MKLKTKKCPYCSNEFSYYSRDGKDRITCSRKCRGLYNKNIGFKPPKYKGDKHPSWKGGKGISKDGYIRVYVSEYNREYEHRVVMEKYLGRKLKTNEHIHHIDGDKTNNDITNLLLTFRREHQHIHHLGVKRKIK